ncbi:IMPACT family protein [Nocardioides marmorisolisilvae]|uniref:IMPACT family protein n=1 Tax=Nocardioides marmorisolisilvae TaxID=1542737 RepID=UPI001FEB5A8A|nr:YigZ family protein [Nocardioides marmorisolisilvae]
MGYLTIASEAEAEIEVSRSRFRCLIVRVEDEMSARGVVEAARREHWNARHHCSAFVLGPTGAVERSSDDGEPPGTGGAPMLEVLRGRELFDVVAVVTRWFGGTLLGTGGLSRAYADAVRAALEGAELIERVEQELVDVTVDLAAAGRLEHELRSRGTNVLRIDYTDVATLQLAVPMVAVPIAEEIVAELTEGAAELVHRGRRWVDAPVTP